MTIKRRGGDTKPKFEYNAFKMHVNNMDIAFPTQLFIDGQFVDATSGKFLHSINPATEELICDVSLKWYTQKDKMNKKKLILRCGFKLEPSKS